MAWSTAPFGLVPRFRRRPEPATQPANAADRADEAAETENGRLVVAPERKGAYYPTPAELRANHRRIFALAPPETVTIRRKLSNALELWTACESASCQRAKACAGVGGAACILDHQEFVMPIVKMAIAQSSGGEAGG